MHTRFRRIRIVLHDWVIGIPVTWHFPFSVEMHPIRHGSVNSPGKRCDVSVSTYWICMYKKVMRCLTTTRPPSVPPGVPLQVPLRSMQLELLILSIWPGVGTSVAQYRGSPREFVVVLLGSVCRSHMSRALCCTHAHRPSGGHRRFWFHRPVHHGAVQGQTLSVVFLTRVCRQQRVTCYGIISTRCCYCFHRRQPRFLLHPAIQSRTRYPVHRSFLVSSRCPSMSLRMPHLA